MVLKTSRQSWLIN